MRRNQQCHHWILFVFFAFYYDAVVPFLHIIRYFLLFQIYIH
jgi:hypothetical protein